MITTRFAPSPTGYLHIGGLRTALFNYLWAKKNKGQFRLRIEDTDQNRLVVDAQEKLLSTLAAVGLKPEGEIIVQSTRLKLYQAAADNLIASNHAYYCFCSTERLEQLRTEQQNNQQIPRYDGHCRKLSLAEAKQKVAQGEKYVIRFRMPENKEIICQDLLHGEIKVNSNDLDDLVIIKSDGFPTYHLANIVDDHDMAITHVIRAEEWLPSLPKHVLLYQAFGYDLPSFIHLPLLLNPDRSKLSKRQGDVAVEDFLAKGYLPEALINYVALLGWNPGTDREFFSLEELVPAFSLDKINKASAVFDLQKLNWFNAEYIRRTVFDSTGDYQKLIAAAKQYLPANLTDEQINRVIRLFASRLNNLAELKTMSEFVFNLPDYSADVLIFKKSDVEHTKRGLTEALAKLEEQAEDKWTMDALDQLLKVVVEENSLGAGDVFWPVRVALSGQEKSPSPAEIMLTLDKKESLTRISKALAKLN